jgi:hypothetical protein
MAMVFSSSVCRIPFIIFWSGSLVVMYCFIFLLSWNISVPPSILNDSFVLEYPRTEIVFFHCLTYLTPCSSSFKGFCWEICCYFHRFTFIYYLIFLFYSFTILFLFSVLIVLTIICHVDVLFWSWLFGGLEDFCTWFSTSFLRFGKFSSFICWLYYIYFG